jgi:methylenetetrahydrofolate reductase (NADPH)
MRGEAEARLAELLARPRYEVIPLDGVEEAVLAHLPREIKLTVTVSPRKGIEPTVDLAARFAAHGYQVVPHVSARLIRDHAHLREIVDRLREAGIVEVFAVAGDAEHALGPFEGAGALLRALTELGRPFPEVGITGYPESHPFISDEATIAAMFEKAEHATYITSQICFDPRVTVRWVENVWARGTRLPINVGLPGVVGTVKLLRISSRLGLGESARFLRKHANWFTRLLLPGAYRPDRLLEGLEPILADPEGKVRGLHLFTFNDLADTERWRRAQLERLAPRRTRAEVTG